MQNILIIGATSAIATATARLYARRGARLYLLARNGERLAALTSDLEIRGARAVTGAEFDATNTGSHRELLETAYTALGRVDLVLVAHGTLPEQRACEQDVALALREFEVNASGTLSLLGHLARLMAEQGSGCIAVISSVAGERGRQSNYLYGSAKAAVSTYLQGLRNRLHSSGVQVLDIRPGFVDTPMTAAFPKGPLWAQPSAVAGRIAGAVDKRRNLVYAPFFWRYIMLLVRLIPEPLFKRMKL